MRGHCGGSCASGCSTWAWFAAEMIWRVKERYKRRVLLLVQDKKGVVVRSRSQSSILFIYCPVALPCHMSSVFV